MYMYTYIYIFKIVVCVCAHMCAIVRDRMEVRRKFVVVVFSFYHVGPGHRIQVIRLGSKSLYPLRHLSGHQIYFQIIIIEFLGLERWLSVRTDCSCTGPEFIPTVHVGLPVTSVVAKESITSSILGHLYMTCTHSKTHIIKNNKNEFLWAEEIFQQLRTFTSLSPWGYSTRMEAYNCP